MAWGESTLGGSKPLWGLPKGPLSPFSFNRLGLGTIGKALGGLSLPFSLYGAGQDTEKSPGLTSISSCCTRTFI